MLVLSGSDSGAVLVIVIEELRAGDRGNVQRFDYDYAHEHEDER